MIKKATSGIILALLLIGMSTFAFNIQPVKAHGNIYIRANGSIDPPTAPVSSVDNVTYTLTGNIYSFVVVQRDNIVVDGADYLLQGDGAYESKGIDLTGRRNVTIKNVEILGFGYGIFLYGSSNNTVFGNNITGSPNNRVGIHLENSRDNNILGNNITDNGTGVEMWYSSNNSISENDIESNWSGVYLEHVSNSSVSGNNIAGHEDYGIKFYWSVNNTVSGNNIADNGEYGIALGLSSSCNYIYHNNFANNPIGVYTQDCANIWDDGYPSGGNYWNYYAGTDLNHGPYQNITGSDGIGDTAYTIDGNNRDNYPLMSPYEYWSRPDLSIEGFVFFYFGFVPLHIYPTPDPGIFYKINVTVTNLGTADAGRFNVSLTVYLEDEIMPQHGRKKTLAGLNQGAEATFTWDFDPQSYGLYTLVITADCDYDIAELDETNNAKSAQVRGTIGGDCDGDGDVDYDDFIVIAGTYGSKFGFSGYNPNADFDIDGDIDYGDFIALAGNFGQHI